MNRNLQPAIELIKRFEGIADGNPATVNLDPYLCPAGVWTIGWGHTVRDSIGRQVKGAENKKKAHSIYQNGIAMEEAERLLAEDVLDFALAIDELINVEINDNQFCAMVSFAFNVGLGAFERSTMLRLLNKGEFDSVPSQIMRWTKAGGRELKGLKRRREAESELWNK